MPPNTADTLEKSSPEQQLSLLSFWSPRQNIDVSVWLRYTSEIEFSNPLSTLLGSPPLDSYLTLDTRLAWRPAKDLELSLVGKNLLDDRHPEAEAEVWVTRGEVPRSVQLELNYAF